MSRLRTHGLQREISQIPVYDYRRPGLYGSTGYHAINKHNRITNEREQESLSSQIDAAFLKTRELYAAFEMLRKDAMFSGLTYLYEPLVRSLCDLSLLLGTGTSHSVRSHLDGIEELRQQRIPNPAIESEMKEVLECLERLRAEPCDDVRSARNVSDDTWRTLLILRSISKKLRRSKVRTQQERAQVRRKLILGALIGVVLIVGGIEARSYLLAGFDDEGSYIPAASGFEESSQRSD